MEANTSLTLRAILIVEDLIGDSDIKNAINVLQK